MERVYAWNNDSIVELREMYLKKEMVNNKDGSLLIMVEHEWI